MCHISNISSFLTCNVMCFCIIEHIISVLWWSWKIMYISYCSNIIPFLEIFSSTEMTSCCCTLLILPNFNVAWGKMKLASNVIEIIFYLTTIIVRSRTRSMCARLYLYARHSTIRQEYVTSASLSLPPEWLTEIP